MYARAAVLVFLFATAFAAAAEAAPPPHGFAFLDVRERSATFWTRAGRAGTVEVTLTAKGMATRNERVAVDPERDFTATAEIGGLTPGTQYAVEVRVPDASGGVNVARGRVETPPGRREKAAARLAFGGDVGGQNACRDQTRGYDIFRVIAERKPQVFIGLGDMIYADNACHPKGRYGNAQVPGPIDPARDLEGFRSRWRYNRNDLQWTSLLAQTAYVPVWDDHEVLNDFGPHHDAPADAPGVHLLKPGMQAFLEYNPIERYERKRLHRHLRWGKHLELFVLDTRQHRDSNAAEDVFASPKSMLGREQREWLLASLTISEATWSVIVSSVPIAIPTGAFPPEAGRDGWTGFDQKTGFEHELRQLLLDLYDAGLRNLVWITTDVHFASVQRFHPFVSHPEFTVYEMATGPLNAGVFPNDLLDDSFHPERLFRWPPTGGDDAAFEIPSFSAAEQWFNFGELEVDEAGSLTMRVVNGRAEVVYEQTLTPAERQPPARPGRSRFAD